MNQGARKFYELIESDLTEATSSSARKKLTKNLENAIDSATSLVELLNFEDAPGVEIQFAKRLKKNLIQLKVDHGKS